MGKVTESIWSRGANVVALALVTHIETVTVDGKIKCYHAIGRHTTYNHEAGDYHNAAIILPEDIESFKSAWCAYRAEFEADESEFSRGCVAGGGDES